MESDIIPPWFQLLNLRPEYYLNLLESLLEAKYIFSYHLLFGPGPGPIPYTKPDPIPSSHIQFQVHGVSHIHPDNQQGCK